MLLLIVIRIKVSVPLQVFDRKKLHVKREREVAISEKSHPPLYQNVTKGKLFFIDGRESHRKKKNSTDAY